LQGHQGGARGEEEAGRRSRELADGDEEEGVGEGGGRRATMWDVMVGNDAGSSGTFDVLDMVTSPIDSSINTLSSINRPSTLFLKVTSPITETKIHHLKQKHDQDLKVALQLQEEEHMAALDLFKAQIREEVEDQMEEEQQEQLVDMQVKGCV
jgi:hypothetical protein